MDIFFVVGLTPLISVVSGYFLSFQVVMGTPLPVWSSQEVFLSLLGESQGLVYLPGHSEGLYVRMTGPTRLARIPLLF